MNYNFIGHISQDTAWHCVLLAAEALLSIAYTWSDIAAWVIDATPAMA